MSVWEYMAMIDGYNRANDPDGGKQLTESEKDDLFELVSSNPTSS
jgi:hypothetical protein